MICRKCKNDLPSSKFRSRGAGKRNHTCKKCERESGLCARCGKRQTESGHYTCKTCTEDKRHYYELIRSQKTPSDVIYETLYRIRKKLGRTNRRKELSCSLTQESLINLYNKQHGLCAVTGIQMTTKSYDPLCMSLDRIDSNKPYHIDNVMFTCRWVNLGRGVCSVEEFKEKVLKQLRAI